MSDVNPLEIIDCFYPDSPLRQILLTHSSQVRDKALEILDNCGLSLDRRLIITGAMLHDIGIRECHAPGILCTGNAPYIAHGVIGARMLREYGAAHHLDLDAVAAICERHTGSGITAAEVRTQSLPIPERDYLPETGEEKLICLADKFFSKSGEMKEKSIGHIRNSLRKFGPDAVARWDEMCRLFGLPTGA